MGSLAWLLFTAQSVLLLPWRLNTSQYLVGSLLFRQTQRKEKQKNSPRTPRMTPGQILLRDKILCHSGEDKCAFHMDRLSMSLFLDQNVRITRGVDLLSSSKSARRSLDACDECVRARTTLHKAHMVTLFRHEEGSTTPARDVALQAWAACRVGVYRLWRKLYRNTKD